MDEYKSIFDFQLFNVNEEEKKSKEKLRKIKHNLNFTSKNEENIKIKLNSMHNYRDEILKYLKKGINKRAISKLIECSPSTLYEWLKRRKLSSN